MGDGKLGAGSHISEDDYDFLASGGLFHFTAKLREERSNERLNYFDGNGGPFVLLIFLQGMNGLPPGGIIALIQCPEGLVKLACVEHILSLFPGMGDLPKGPLPKGRGSRSSLERGMVRHQLQSSLGLPALKGVNAYRANGEPDRTGEPSIFCPLLDF